LSGNQRAGLGDSVPARQVFLIDSERKGNVLKSVAALCDVDAVLS
jgi:hypothetical protein